MPILRNDPDREHERLRGIARRFGYGSLVGPGVLVIALTLVHLRQPKLQALQGAILLASLVIVWIGLELATGG